jgi:hypothetical protein
VTRRLALHHLGRLWPLIALPAAVLMLFSLLFVVMIEPIGGLAIVTSIIRSVPAIERIMGVAGVDYTTHAGIAAIAYIHPLTAILLLVWPLGLAAATLVGEIETGVADLLLCRAVPRGAMFRSAAVTLCVGTVVLSLAMWVGTALGAALTHFPADLPVGRFALAAVTQGVAVFALGSVALLLSAMSEDRGRLLVVAVALWVVDYFNGRLSPIFASLGWLRRWSVQGHCRPVTVIDTGNLLWGDLAVLLAISVAALILGAILWRRRDIRA